jgi:small subunit ribosomal protein S9
MVKEKIIQKSGRRKTSVARVTLKKGSGIFRINNEDVDKYFSDKISNLKVKEPLIISDLGSKYDLKVNVFGGGISSQADAIRQAIAKALVEVTGSEDLKKKFLEYDRSLLVADTRFKEMKKPNNSHARAKRQKSYR